MPCWNQGRAATLSPSSRAARAGHDEAGEVRETDPGIGRVALAEGIDPGAPRLGRRGVRAGDGGEHRHVAETLGDVEVDDAAQMFGDFSRVRLGAVLHTSGHEVGDRDRGGEREEQRPGSENEGEAVRSLMTRSQSTTPTLAPRAEALSDRHRPEYQHRRLCPPRASR